MHHEAICTGPSTNLNSRCQSVCLALTCKHVPPVTCLHKDAQLGCNWRLEHHSCNDQHLSLCFPILMLSLHSSGLWAPPSGVSPPCRTDMYCSDGPPAKGPDIGSCSADFKALHIPLGFPDPKAPQAACSGWHQMQQQQANNGRTTNAPTANGSQNPSRSHESRW